jgi:hypothetical protein
MDRGSVHSLSWREGLVASSLAGGGKSGHKVRRKEDIMAEAGNVPVRQSVGVALRFVRENWRFLAVVSAIGAGALAMITAFSMAVPALGIFAAVAQGIVQACIYGAFTAAALYGAASVRGRWTGDGWRVWGAMAILFFFLFIVFTVITIPVLITLFAGPLSRYVADLQTAGEDQAAVLAVMTRFAEENPGVLLAVTLFYLAIWLLLTSRLYLAAPASVDQGRILVFDTWKWTKGAMLRIAGARLLLLLPANILVGALGYIVGRLVGLDTLDLGAMAEAATANPAATLVYTTIASFLTFWLYSALEAGLSAYLYTGLKPAAPAPEQQSAAN